LRIDLRENAACTGASTFEVIGGLPQLSELNQDTGLVTLTVGAANLDLAGVLTACTAVPPDPAGCQEAITFASGQVMALGSSLSTLYTLVDQQAPDALIVVTGYPHLFEIVPGDQTAALKKQINDAIEDLNNTIRQTVRTAQGAGVNIVYVDVTEEFAGHGIGSEEPFINADDPETPPVERGAYHPNAAGYRAYAKAIFAAIRSALLGNNKQVA
jgi:lysophospholipase L1-like esterase